MELPAYPIQYTKNEDVEAEEKRVEMEGPDGQAVWAQKLTKAYRVPDKRQPVKLAVHQLSFAVAPGEIFSILGPSSSGKSSVLKVLARLSQASAGEVGIFGQGLQYVDPSQIGHAPQEDNLSHHLTVLEHMKMYAVTKGVPEESRGRVIDALLSDLELGESRNTETAKLGDGAKRKLIVALAVIGNPAVLILDEPTSRIDPQARRCIWRLVWYIAQLRKEKAAVVISTHTLEEAEALSTKLAIMINGTLRCFGNPQTIKSKYAVGYFIDIKFEEPTVERAQQLADTLGISRPLGILLHLQSIALA